MGWLVPTAHNGYYDLLLGVGFFGAVCFLPVFLQMVARSLHYLTTERSSARLFPVAYLAFWLVYNLNESALVARSGIPFMLFVAISVSLAMQRSSKAVLGQASKQRVPGRLQVCRQQAASLTPL